MLMIGDSQSPFGCHDLPGQLLIAFAQSGRINS
jgi:hypothetical protein